MKRPRVSVNIPVYNGERTIAAAVRSVLEQDYADFELVVVNDCSRDSTAAILASIQDPRLRVIHHEQNKGISHTRNDALVASRGELIAVLDADDLALPGRLARQVTVLNEHPELAGIFSWSEGYRDDPGQVVSRYHPRLAEEALREQLLFESPFVHSSACLRRAALGAGYREDLSCGEDYAKWVELAHQGERLGMIHEPLVRCWQHPPSFYTSEKMRETVQALQATTLWWVLGRALTPAERDAHWSLYEITGSPPTSRKEAGERMRLAWKWVHALCGPGGPDTDRIDRGRLAEIARGRIYLLAQQLAPAGGVAILREAWGIDRKDWIKLLVKQCLRASRRSG